MTDRLQLSIRSSGKAWPRQQKRINWGMIGCTVLGIMTGGGLLVGGLLCLGAMLLAVSFSNGATPVTPTRLTGQTRFQAPSPAIATPNLSSPSPTPFNPTATLPPPEPSPTATPLPSPTQPAATPDFVVAAPGQRIERNGLALTIDNVSRLADEDGECLVIEATFENLNQDMLAYSSTDFRLMRENEPLELTNACGIDQPFAEGEVNSGEQVQGQLSFRQNAQEQSAGTQSLYLIYQHLAPTGGYQLIIVNLGPF